MISNSLRFNVRGVLDVKMFFCANNNLSPLIAGLSAQVEKVCKRSEKIRT